MKPGEDVLVALSRILIGVWGVSKDDGFWPLPIDGVCVDTGVRDASSDGTFGMSVRLGEAGDAGEGVGVLSLPGVGVTGAPPLGVLSRAGLLRGVCSASGFGDPGEGV